MELAVRGWRRDHGETVICQRDLATAEVGKFSSFSRDATYVTVRPAAVGASAPTVEIRFDAKIVLNGDYQGRIALTKREVASLFFLLHAETSLDDLMTELVRVRELQDAGPLLPLPNLPFPATMLRKLDDLELSVRTSNTLKSEHIEYIGDLAQKSAEELIRIPNFGRRSLNEVTELLAQMGLELEMHVPQWPPENVKELAKRFRNLYPD